MLARELAQELEERERGGRTVVAQERGLHGWPDWHIMGPGGWCGSVVRHTGMFAVTSKMYPLTFLKEMYDLDEAAERLRELGLELLGLRLRRLAREGDVDGAEVLEVARRWGTVDGCMPQQREGLRAPGWRQSS